MYGQDEKYKPIGVFDSGLGGLTVVKELVRQLPGEDIVYYGDTARVPYGTKSKESIIRFSIENANVLLRHKVKMIVVACNSCSSYALSILRKSFDVPIVGVIEAGAQKAVMTTHNKRVGVIATQATISSQKYAQTIKDFNKSVSVFSQPCPLFVPLVEEGWGDKEVTLNVANEYLKNLKKVKVDTLILGCTHYPLLKNTLTKAMGKKVCLVDSAKEVALEVKALLEKMRKLNNVKKSGQRKFLVSDKPQEFKKIARQFLGFEIKDLIKVENHKS